MKNEIFEEICKLTQNQLVMYNLSILKKIGYENIIREDGFVYAKGTVPILLVAHMDTVHKKVPSKIKYNKEIIKSPQGIGGDDRCGIYMIHKIIEKHKCSVLFLEDEEIGCVGAKKFVKSKYINDLDVNYMIELDRKGNQDAVFYECDNPEFTEFIINDSPLKEDYGSYTDICTLMPATGIAGVNISCGYYNAHTKDEYVNLQEMENLIIDINKIVEKPCNEKFDFIERDSSWYDDDYNLWLEEALHQTYLNYGNNGSEANIFKITYDDYLNGEFIVETSASSEAEAVGIFLMCNEELPYSSIISVEQL
ncbi:hypothetical protein [Clostridium sp.]|uniref:hypothetical protein n=1 Tax=Clostridium sp. TaxID=1506 RepID=UPI0032168141